VVNFCADDVVLVSRVARPEVEEEPETVEERSRE